MSEIFILKSVTKKYGSKLAVDQANFSLPKGSYVGLIGNNGSGKTTLVHMMCNLIPYNEGQILFKDQKVHPNFVSYKRQLGIILSKPYYIEEYSAVEFWRFVGKFQKVSKPDVEKRIEDLLKVFSLEDDRDKPIQKLSSGNQMKITLGSALIHNPEMLILDEPFINLDINMIEKLLSILKSFKGQKTLFITSHNLDLVADLCDSFIIIDEGKIVMNLNKSDFNSIEELKDEVKKLLAENLETNDLSWLT